MVPKWTWRRSRHGTVAVEHSGGEPLVWRRECGLDRTDRRRAIVLELGSRNVALVATDRCDAALGARVDRIWDSPVESVDDRSTATRDKFQFEAAEEWNFEIGTEARSRKTLFMQLVGFWTFYRDEIISVTNQSTHAHFHPTPIHRNIAVVEVFYDWRRSRG